MFFTEKFSPRMSDFDRNGRLSFEAVLQMVETAGSNHSNAVNDNVIEGSRRGNAWIVAEWRGEILREPENACGLKNTTWIRKTPSLATVWRDFEVTDNSGEVYIRAEAKSCIVNTETRRLTRISDELMNAYLPEEKRAFEEDEKKLRAPKELRGETPVFVRESDIDFNGHVHNTRYMSYFLEVLPKERRFNSFRIAYLKSVTKEDRVTVGLTETDEGVFAGVFADQALCALALFK